MMGHKPFKSPLFGLRHIKKNMLLLCDPDEGYLYASNEPPTSYADRIIPWITFSALAAEWVRRHPNWKFNKSIAWDERLDGLPYHSFSVTSLVVVELSLSSMPINVASPSADDFNRNAIRKCSVHQSIEVLLPHHYASYNSTEDACIF